MNPRDRTFLSLEHKRADRLPVDFWASSSMKQKITSSFGMTFEQFLDECDVDLRFIDGPKYTGPAMPPGLDIWGVKRRMVEVQTKNGTEQYEELETSPLAEMETVEQIDSYSGWPSPDCYDYSVIKSQCQAIRDKGRVVVFMGDRLNRVAQLKPAMYLRGVENIMMDVAINPEIAMAIFQRIRNFYLIYLQRILESAGGLIDIVLTGDDFGSQNGLLVSPDMWRCFLGDGFEKFNKLIHDAGAKTMHHTCGSVEKIIPDMIDRGLDILQSLQPEAAGMNIAGLKEKHGRRLSFHGGISIQQAMPFGTPQDVEKEVAKMAELFRNDGGYIFCTSHNIQADTPIENVRALIDAYKKYSH